MKTVPLDVCDHGSVAKALAATTDVVFHLAFTRQRPDLTARVALDGTDRLLTEVSRTVSRPRVVLVSSGAVYGFASGIEPLTEESTPIPADYYGVLKYSQELLAAAHRRRSGLDVVVVRPFNIAGPGETGDLVTGSLARQIALGEKYPGSARIEVGNTDSWRDYVDVRDVAAALVAVAGQSDASGVFNVCSGTPVRIAEVLSTLLSQARRPFVVVRNEARSRPGSIPYQVGSSGRLRHYTGWQPDFDLLTTLSDLLEDMRERVQGDRS